MFITLLIGCVVSFAAGVLVGRWDRKPRMKRYDGGYDIDMIRSNIWTPDDDDWIPTDATRRFLEDGRATV